MDVESNVTVPPTLRNVSVSTNTTYESTDACGITKNRTTNTITGKGPNGTDRHLWCSRWSEQRDTWVTEGCTVTQLSENSSSMASNATTGATVTCKCSVVLPADTKDDSFSADVSLVAIYAFSRVSNTFERDTPVDVSPRVVLLCGVPTFLFLVLLVAYRFIPHRVFSYQRGGHLSDEEKTEWCVTILHSRISLCVCYLLKKREWRELVL